MPAHVLATSGDYAPSCLLPGDPDRARLVAERFLAEPVEVSSGRGLLGFTGSFEGTPVSIQASGMGGPSAAIVVEELVELGVERLIRIGTCGSLAADVRIGELVLPTSAFPSDGTSRRLAGEPHAPTPSWSLLSALAARAGAMGASTRVGPIASCDLFYERVEGQNERWAELGAIAVEMECSTLFTLAALRRVEAAAVLIVTDELASGERRRIPDSELPLAVESAARIALEVATA